MADARAVRDVPGWGHVEYVEFGARDGTPALYLHGTPSSAAEGHWLDGPALECGVRLIAVDRPGYLGSSPLPAASLARGVTSFLDELGLARLGLVAFSGGTTLGLALAAHLGDRASTLQVGGGVGSMDALRAAGMRRRRVAAFAAMSAWPHLAVALASARRRVAKRASPDPSDPAAGLRELLGAYVAGPQAAALEAYARDAEPAALQAFVRGAAAGLASPRGVASDLAMLRHRVDLHAVGVHVELWHGGLDRSVPVGAARQLATALPNATLHEFPEEGHFVFLTHGREVCDAVHRSMEPDRR